MGIRSISTASISVDHPTVDAIRSLRCLSTVDDLMRGVPELIVRMGFDRVLLSECRDDMWTPMGMTVPKDRHWGEDILLAGRENPRRLDQTLVETRMAKTRRPLHVVDVQNHPGVHRPLAQAAKTSAYLGVPVVVGESVGAFIHVDRYWAPNPLTSTDADKLTIFAEFLGLALEQALLVDRVGMLAAELGGMTNASARSIYQPAVGQPTVARESASRAELTPRENEVARLVAQGKTNDQIATELVLTDATVKTYVKHVLRKLGASHRAEAVSLLIRSGVV